MRECLYFGAGDGGHFLRALDGRITIHPERFGLPWTIGLLDGGLLANSGEPDRVTGRVRSTCGCKPTRGAEYWWAFYWWDRSGDSRPGSNSGFYVKGFVEDPIQRGALAALAYAQTQWPDVIARQACPLVLV